jgi:methyl-accepting chemotaxis protein
VLAEQQLHRIATAAERLADHFTHPNRAPAWAQRMEQTMADLAEAIANLQAVDQTVVDELVKLADEVRNAPDVSAAADMVQAEADRLAQAVSDAETPPSA